MQRLVTIIAVVLFVSALSLAGAEPTYIGAAKCKLCHKVEHTSWSEMSHAKAFDLLKPEEQGDAECLKCHATGGTADMPGVQCEACHGPGSDYKSMKTMKDPDASLAAGLVKPDAAACEACHTGAPHEQADFDYETAKQAGIHEFKNPE